MERIKEKNPDKYEELRKLRTENPRQFLRELGKLMREHSPRGRMESHEERRRFHEQFLEHLRTADPERFARLQKLRAEDPEAARREMRKIFHAFRRKHFQQDDKAAKLAERYHQAETEESKAAAKAELEQAVRESFDQRIRDHEQRIEKIRLQLAEMEENLARFREKKEEICKKRIRHLLDQLSEDAQKDE